MTTLALLTLFSSGAVVSLALLVTRWRALLRQQRSTAARARRLEMGWTCVRLRSAGLTGVELQEAMCRITNCTPDQADRVIGTLRHEVDREEPR